jgi:hypothetical protein
VFLTSADGIELFASKDPFPSELKPFTITALAHPSSTQIGSTHGVYLLKDPNEQVIKDKALPAHEQSALLLECERFLHKPSLGMILKTYRMRPNFGPKARRRETLLLTRSVAILR